MKGEIDKAKDHVRWEGLFNNFNSSTQIYLHAKWSTLWLCESGSNHGVLPDQVPAIKSWSHQPYLAGHQNVSKSYITISFKIPAEIGASLKA